MVMAMTLSLIIEREDGHTLNVVNVVIFATRSEREGKLYRPRGKLLGKAKAVAIFSVDLRHGNDNYAKAKPKQSWPAPNRTSHTQ